MLSKKKLQQFIVLLVFCTFCLSAKSVAQKEFSQIMNNMKALFATASDNSVAVQMSAQNSDGSWPDIDYASQSQTNWVPGNHWVRLNLFCRAYTNPASIYFESPLLRTGIINGINYWLSLSPAPSSTNWYMGTISLPRDIGTALIAMRYAAEPLPSNLETACIAWMNKGISISVSPAKDGANLFEVGENYIMRACLTQDASLLTQTITAVGNGIVIATSISAEGVQPDFSFRAHGPQLHMYGYGNSFISSAGNLTGYVSGTSFAFSPEKVAVISGFVRKGFVKATRGIYADYNCFGRSISRPGSTKASAGLVAKAKAVDLPAYASEYDQAISRMNGSQLPSYQITPEHLHYWRSDYTIHHRAGYMFGLRTVSSRTYKSERGNAENLKGNFVTDGANYIAVNGNEYYDIFPVWDWNKIPGTTVPEVINLPTVADWGVPGTSVFTGGASDGQYGVNAYAMNDYNTKAKKAWFFFDKEVVCLGAGISSTAPEAINTSVNQCVLDGAVNVKAGGAIQSLANGSRLYNNNLQWVHHDSVGYIFPQGGTVSLSNQTQNGDWYSINNTYSNAPVSTDVFKLYFRHGTAPSAGNYAYVVVPGISLQEMNGYDASIAEVWSNTDGIQAVYHSGLDMLQVIFYQAGYLSKNGITIKASAPCVAIVRNVSSANPSVLVADPSQSLSSLNIAFQNPALSNAVNYAVVLPTGNMAGSTIQAQVGPVIVQPAVPVNVTAIGDAYVRDGSFATTNFPTGNLTVKKDAVGFARRAFMQFNLSAYAGAFDSAFLRVYVTSANTTITSTSWEFHEATDNTWTETGINWNNQPAVTASPIATAQGRAAGNFVTVPVTATVNSRLQADKKLSLRISSTVSGGTTDASFTSRESTTVSQRPVLLLYGVIDTTKPVLMAPADIFVPADAGTLSATNVMLGTATASDLNGIQSVSNNAPLVYPIGSTTITWTATDNKGNVATAIQMVTVQDKEKPVLNAPASQNFCFRANGNYQADAATASDNAGVQSIVYAITGATERYGEGADASGAFNVGTSMITWTVTDINGNVANGTTSVQVYELPAVFIPNVYAMNPATDLKNTIYVGYGPTSLAINALAEGGTPAYQYQWSNGDQSAGTTVSAAGTYSVVVTDAHHCQASASIIMYTLDVQCGNNSDKVMICHNGKTICVASGSVQDHMNHGDAVGSCEAITRARASMSAAIPSTSGTNQLKVYPNPVVDQMHFVFNNPVQDATAELFNVTGQKLMSFRITGSHRQQSMRSIAKGTYLLLVRKGEEIYKTTIIKQ